MKTGEKVTFASVRPTTGWTLTFEGMRKAHFIRVYTRGKEGVLKDLTTGKIYHKNEKS